MAWIPIAAAAIGAAGSLFGNKNQGQYTQTPQSQNGYSSSINTMVPNAAAYPLYGYAAGNAYKLATTPRPYYPGQTYVSPSDLTQEGVNTGAEAIPMYKSAADMYDQAISHQVDAAQTGTNNYNFLSNAADIPNNQYVQGMLNQNSQAATDWLQQKALPSIQQGAISVNGLGNDRLGIAQGTAIGQAQKNLLSQNAATQLSAYGQGLNAQNSALALTPTVQQSYLAPGNAKIQAANAVNTAGKTALGYGGTVEGYQQAALKDQIARFNYPYDQAWANQNNVYKALQALMPLGTTYNNGATSGNSTTTQANPYYQSPYQSAVGGALTGYGLYNAYQQAYPTQSSGYNGTYGGLY